MGDYQDRKKKLARGGAAVAETPVSDYQSRRDRIYGMDQPASFDERLRVLRHVSGGKLSPGGFDITEGTEGGIAAGTTDDPEFKRVRSDWRKDIESEFGKVGIPKGVTRGQVNKILSELPDEATFGEKATVLGGRVAAGLNAPALGITRALIPRAMRNMPSRFSEDDISEAMAGAEGVADPSKAALGDRYSVALKALQSTSLGRGGLMASEAVGMVASMASGGKMATRLVGAAEKAGIKATAGGVSKIAPGFAKGGVGLGTYSGLSSADDDPVGAFGGGLLAGTLMHGLAVPMQKLLKTPMWESFLGKFAAGTQRKIVHNFAHRTQGGLSMTGANTILHGPDGERILHDMVLGWGLTGKPEPLSAKVVGKAKKLTLDDVNAAKVEFLVRGAKDIETGETRRGPGEEVMSKSRMEALKEGKDLDEIEAKLSADGENVEAGWKPIKEARKEGLIVPEAEPAIKKLEDAGVEPFNSHVDPKTGEAHALGIDIEGRVVSATVKIHGPVEGRDFATSNKNEVVNRERAERGVEEMPEEAPRGHEGVVAEARAVAAKASTRPAQTVEKLLKNKTAGTVLDAALLDIHRVNLHNARAQADVDGVAAAKRGDMDAVAEAKSRTDQIGEDFLRLEEASKSAGREWGRLGAFRQRMMAQDYSLLNIERIIRAENNFEKGTPEVEAARTKQAKELSDKLTKVQAERDSLLDQRADWEASLTAQEAVKGLSSRKAPKSGSKNFGAENKVVKQPAYDKAVARSKARIERQKESMGSGMSPKDLAEMLADGLVIGGYRFEAGVRKYKQWAKEMVADMGAGVKPHLRAMWVDVNKQFVTQTREESLSKIKAGVEEGKAVADMHNEVGKIAESVIAEGKAKGNKAEIDATHKIVLEIAPDATRRDVSLALTKYGKVQKLDTDPIKTRLRELKAEELEHLKIEDMEAGKAPSKTGREAQEPSDYKRELTRRVNELKKKSGLDKPDPAKHLRSINQTAERRLTNQLKDLQTEIKTMQRLPSSVKNTSPEYSAKVKALAQEVKELRKVRDELLGKPGMSDAQRNKLLIKAAEKSLAEYERRIAQNDLFPGSKRVQGPAEADLAAARARRDAAKQALAELKTAERPPRTWEEVALGAMKTRRVNETAKMKARLANRDFGDRVKRPPVEWDAELTEIDVRFETAKRELNEAIMEHRLANMTKAQKLRRLALVEIPGLVKGTTASTDISFFERQGFFQLMAHPIRTMKGLPAAIRSMKSVAPKDATLGQRIFKRDSPSQLREEARIKNRENYDLAVEAGIEFTDHGPTKILKQAEEFQGELVGKVPIVAASGRAHTTGLNRVRMDAFDGLISTLSRFGKPTLAEAKLIANYVNVTTGRPSVGHGKLAKALVALGPIAWAPRLVYSRFQAVTLQPLLARRGGYKGTLKVRALIATEYARTLASLFAIYALAEKAGAETPFRSDSKTRDPLSTDFGKIIVGDRRFDILAGLSQAIVFTGRQVRGKKTTGGGKSVSLVGPKVGYKGDTRLTVLGSFMRSKLGPIPGAFVDSETFGVGSNFIGEKTTVASTIESLTVPLAVRDIYESMRTTQNMSHAAAISMLALMGVGVSNHSKSGKKSSSGRPTSVKR